MQYLVIHFAHSTYRCTNGLESEQGQFIYRRTAVYCELCLSTSLSVFSLTEIALTALHYCSQSWGCKMLHFYAVLSLPQRLWGS